MLDYIHLAEKFKIMGHPIRLKILNLLRQGEVCVCHIEHTLGHRQAYISQQLMALREAGMVETRKDGLQVYYRLVDSEVQELLDFLWAEESSFANDSESCPCPSCNPEKALTK